MSSEPPPNYASLPSVTTTFISRARDTSTSHSIFATLRPWHHLFQQPFSSFTRPPNSFTSASIRIKTNLGYFRVNYTLIVLLIVFLSLLWHPISMIVFLIVFIAWFFLYFSRDEAFVLFNRRVDDRVVLIVLGVVTIVTLVMTQVLWVNVMVSVLIGVLIVGLHAAFRATEDLYVDEGEVGDGGLVSFVGRSVWRFGF